MDTDNSTPRPGNDGENDAAADEVGAAISGHRPAAADDDLIGDRLGGELEQSPPIRRPSPGRKRQHETAIRERKRRLLAADPDLTEAELEQRAQAQVREEQQLDPDTARAVEQVKPALTVKPSADVDRDVEVRAMMLHPRLIWIRLWLQTCWSGPTEKCFRSLPVAVGLHMGFAFGRAQIKQWRDTFRRAYPVEAWQQLYPTDLGPDDPSAFYKQIKRVFGTGRDYKAWGYVNRDLVRELAGELVEHTDKNGKVRRTSFARVPDALRYLVLDAVLLQADLEQRKPADEEEAQLMRKVVRAMCGFLSYTRIVDKGKLLITRKAHGYKWLEILDLKLQVPLCGLLMPANGDERKYGLKLLELLLALYPELKRVDEYFLVCDRLYDTEDFAYAVLIKFGGHVVAPRAGKIAKTYEWAKTGGIPECDCGDLAVLAEQPDWPTPLWRLQNGLPEAGRWCKDESGKLVDSARTRWKCRNDAEGCNPPATYFRENPRLYTKLPHGGQGKLQGLRKALSAYRNVIESGFAWAEDTGFGGTALERPRWAKDDQMQHFAWMVAVGRTLRKVIHRDGLYDAAYADADESGLLTAATARKPAPGPSDRSEHEENQMRACWLEQARPPDGWHDPGLRLDIAWTNAAQLWAAAHAIDLADIVDALAHHGRLPSPSGDDAASAG